MSCEAACVLPTGHASPCLTQPEELSAEAISGLREAVEHHEEIDSAITGMLESMGLVVHVCAGPMCPTLPTAAGLMLYRRLDLGPLPKKPAAPRWVYDDGGRKEAGFKGDTGDCVVRAISIALEKPYIEIYDLIKTLAKDERVTKRMRDRSSPRTGVYKKTYKQYLTKAGWIWHPTMGIGTGCRVHLRASELPSGRLIVEVSKHVVAMIDGAMHDTHDPSRDGMRCVYGYWSDV